MKKTGFCSLLFVAILMLCSEGSGPCPDGGTALDKGSLTENNAAVCDEGKTWCNETEQVEKYIGGSWRL